MSTATTDTPTPRAPGRARFEHLAGLAAVASSATRLDVTTAATGEDIGQIRTASPVDVAEAAAAARQAQIRWAATSVAQRAQVIKRFAALVLERQDEILDIIQLENGKARRHAFEEILDVGQVCRYYASTARALMTPHRRRGALPVLTRTWEYHHPKGLVAVIAPWNYPLSLGISDAIPALLAGNAVLIKPDEQTPFSTLWCAELLAAAGLPEHVFSVLTGLGPDIGEPLIAASDVLMFTGSTRVGKQLAVTAAARLIDYSMELGGKNAMLVLDDADIERTLDGAARACFANTGQLCISMERMYINTAVWDEFVPRFVTKTRNLTLGHALDYRFDIGSLISPRQLDTVVRHVDDAVAKGATVLAGGTARPDLGPAFYEPTILTDTTPTMTVFADETFGPVVSLYRVENDEEAISAANASSYGLSFSVWTRDSGRGREVATQLQAGNVNINEGYAAAWGSLDVPMGGWKNSGSGTRHGAHGLLKYTDTQNIAEQRWLALGQPDGISPTTYASIMTLALKAMQRIPGLK